MSISQLDDAAMREALGIETDIPSSFSNPIQIGTVRAGATIIANGRTGLQQGVAFLNGLDANGNKTVGGVYVNDPLDQNYMNAVVLPRGFGFQQALTGQTDLFATYNDIGSITTLNANAMTCDNITVVNAIETPLLQGSGGGAALTNIATINGSAYPPAVSSVPNNSASTGSYNFANLTSYPTSLWYDTIQNRVPNGKKFLLTMCLNFQLIPTTAFVGHDVITIRCGQSTGSPANPPDNFAEPQVDLIYPDGTVYTRYPFTIINQVELVSDAMGTWSVIAEAVSSAGGHAYNISGTAAVLSIVELFS